MAIFAGAIAGATIGFGRAGMGFAKKALLTKGAAQRFPSTRLGRHDPNLPKGGKAPNTQLRFDDKMGRFANRGPALGTPVRLNRVRPVYSQAAKAAGAGIAYKVGNEHYDRGKKKKRKHL